MNLNPYNNGLAFKQSCTKAHTPQTLNDYLDLNVNDD